MFLRQLPVVLVNLFGVNIVTSKYCKNLFSRILSWIVEYFHVFFYSDGKLKTYYVWYFFLSKAGYRMMAVTDPGLCRRVTLRHSAAQVPIAFMLPLFDVTNWWFLLEVTPVNMYFTYLAWKFSKESNNSSSRKLFRFSLLHLPLVMLLALVNKNF